MRTVILPDPGPCPYAGTGYANPDAPTQIANGLSTTTFTYDNNGNVTQKTVDGTTTTYIYDYANRLTALGVLGATTTYAYDWAGNRVSQTGTTTTFIYPFKWYSVASSTGTGAKYATTTDYVFNGDNQVATVDQQTASGNATGTAKTRYIHPDHLGSTNVVTDENDNVTQTLDYFPYGALRVSVSTSTNVQRKFIGQFSDQSNLDYLNARYYNGSQGQFTSQDPVFLGDPKRQNLQDPQSLNSYSYSDDNPITKSDPTGRTSALIPGQGLVHDYNGTNETVCCSPGSTYQYLQNPAAAEPSSQSGSKAPAAYNRFGTTWMNNYFANVQFGVVSLGGGNTPAGAATGIGAVGLGAGMFVGSTWVLGAGIEAADAPGIAGTAEHIFGDANLAKHGLGPLLAEYGGDKIAATRALQGALNAAKAAGSVPAVYKTAETAVNVIVNGRVISITGQIVDDIARMGSAFIQ
jgi:RHS repeat-associated protein